MASNEEIRRKCKVEACVFTRCGVACQGLVYDFFIGFCITLQLAVSD